MKYWNALTAHRLPWNRSSSTPRDTRPWSRVRTEEGEQEESVAPTTPTPETTDSVTLQEVPLTRTATWQFWTPERLAARWERSEDTNHV